MVSFKKKEYHEHMQGYEHMQGKGPREYRHCSSYTVTKQGWGKDAQLISEVDLGLVQHPRWSALR